MKLLTLEFILLRYTPNAFSDEGINVGLLVWSDRFVDFRFTKNWDRISRFDSNADLEMLDAVRTDMELKIRSADWRKMLQRIEDSFSNTIQCSERGNCVCADPTKEVENLTSIYFEDDLETSPLLA